MTQIAIHNTGRLDTGLGPLDRARMPRLLTVVLPCLFRTVDVAITRRLRPWWRCHAIYRLQQTPNFLIEAQLGPV